MVDPTEPTGSQPLQGPPATQSRLVSMALAIALSVVGGAGGGYATSASGVGAQAAETAQLVQRTTELERRVTTLEGQLAGVEPLRREVAALSATMSAQNAGIVQRLGRIEAAIDRDRVRGQRHVE